MKTNLFNQIIISALCLLATACSKDGLTPSGGGGGNTTHTYKNLVIEKFEYDTIPAAGGTVSPIVEYSYTDVANNSGSITETRMTSGAQLTYTLSNGSTVTIDENGAVTAALNENLTKLENTVTVTLSKGENKTSRTASLVQRGSNDYVVDSYYEILPIELEPHTCAYYSFYNCESVLEDQMYKGDYNENVKERTYTSYNTDGKIHSIDEMGPQFIHEDQMTRWENLIKINDFIGFPEYVATNGTTVKFHGGEYVQIIKYRSGDSDTTVIEQPVFSTKTTYKKSTDTSGWNKKDNSDFNDATQLPSSSVQNNIWSINKIGTAVTYENEHVLTAKAGGMETSITLYQQKNYAIEEIPAQTYFERFLIWTPRYHYPNYEDFPAGSNPKWLKVNQVRVWESSYDDSYWWDNKFTEYLHPDSDRNLDFRILPFFKRYYPTYRFRSGAVQNPKRKLQINKDANSYKGMEYTDPNSGEEMIIFSDYFMHYGVTIIAKADVRLTNGQTKHVEHVSQWLCYDKNKSDGVLGMYIPVVENAAEDFQWTVTIHIEYNDDDLIHSCESRAKYTDFNEVWKDVTFTFWDRLSTFNDWWTNGGGASGLYGGGYTYTHEYDYGDIIDGVNNTKSYYFTRNP